MTRAVVPPDLNALVAAVGRAMDGSGPPVAPLPPLSDAAPPEGTALVLRTSGSTGAPREVLLSAAALRASGAATADRLGGPGHWLLTIPADHVAGVQVVARAHVAGRGLTVAPREGAFTAEGFAADAARAVRSADGARRYVSLVPTQLHRLAAAADAGAAAGLDALAGFDAVLVGGAATPPGLLARVRSAGARVVTTYGMTETCGGCVYDGVPLAGVGVRLVAGSPGVVEISGPVLATGYLDRPAETAAAFPTDPDGTRWFRTSDLGAWAGSGDERRLRILGRADDVVVTGGVNVAPSAVEAVVAGVRGVGEVCVVGVPDAEWGQAVVAVVTRAAGPGTSSPTAPAPLGPPLPAEDALFAEVRRRVTATLGRAAAPRRVLVVRDLPRRGPGKVDRLAVARDVVGLNETPAARD